LNALPGDVEIEHQACEIAVRKIREQRVAERIVSLEQDQHSEIGQVAEHAGHGEASVGRTPQCRSRAVIVEALQCHRAMRLQLVNLIHFTSR
jgi:hypothetical protein